MLISVTVITLDESGRAHSFTSGLKSVANDIFSPVRNGVNDRARARSGTSSPGPSTTARSRRRTRSCSAELGVLQQQAEARARAGAAPTAAPAAARPPAPALPGPIPTVMAQTIAVNPSNFAATITIDKGRSAGRRPWATRSWAPAGWSARSSRPTTTQSTVRLITDGQSHVGVTFGDPADRPRSSARGPATR